MRRRRAVGGVQGVGDDQQPVRLPSTCSTASSSGANAGISLDFAAMVTWARTMPVLVLVSNVEKKWTWPLRPRRLSAADSPDLGGANLGRAATGSTASASNPKSG